MLTGCTGQQPVHGQHGETTKGKQRSKIASSDAGGFGTLSQDFPRCFVANLSPHNKLREEAIAGVYESGIGNIVSPANEQPMLKLYDTCMTTEALFVVIEARLASQPDLVAALDLPCVTAVAEGSERLEFLSAIFIRSGPRDQEIVDDAVFGCVDLGALIAPDAGRDFGVTLAPATIACLRNTAEGLDMLRVLTDRTAFDSWRAHSLAYYSDSEAAAIGLPP